MEDKETYGKVLNRQLMAIDFLNRDLSKDLRKDHLLRYIKDLGISFFTLHSRETIGKKTALQTDPDYLVNGSPRTPNQTVEFEGRPRDQVSFVYLLKEPCWILGDDHEELANATVYCDLWSGRDLTGFPKYTKRADSTTKTSVIIPAASLGDFEPEAIVNFEFDEVVQPTPILEEELRLLADIAFAIRRNTIDSQQERNSTIEAFDIIRTDAEYRGASNAILAVLLATDIVNQNIFDRAKQKIEDRINALGAGFYVFHQSCDLLIRGNEIEPGYTPSKDWNKGWRNNGTELLGNSNPILENGEVTTQVGYVFDRLNAAVIRGDAETFGASSVFTDERNDNARVPDYAKNSIHDTCVSIICPSISKDNEIFGVVNYEFSGEPPCIDDIFVQGLTELARSIGRLQHLFDTSKAKRELSKQSISDLDPFVDPRLQFKQQIFFAYPKEGSEPVIKSITQAIEELANAYKQRLVLVRWEDAARVGSAQTNLRQDIATSQFVIGYLSEPLEDEIGKYKNNINVMLELTAAYFEREDKVLGIREENTVEDLPFDLRDMQLVEVKRNQEQQIEEHFQDRVVSMVARALSLAWPPEPQG